MPRGVLTPLQREKQLAGIRSLENRKRQSESAIKMWLVKDMTARNKKVSESRLGSKHPLWKGNAADYTSLHEWIRKHYLDRNTCEDCGLEKPLDAANVSGEYDRDNRNDWRFLCRKCHMLSDKRLEKLIAYNYKKI